MKTKQERAQSMVIFAVALLGLLAFVALASDGGRLYVERRNAQSAADSAALAAGRVKVQNGGEAAIIDAGRTIAAKNGFGNDGVSSTVNVYPKPISGPYSGNDKYVQVIIFSTFKTSFLQLFSRNQIVNQSEAVVLATKGDKLLGDDIIVGYNKTDCDSFAVNGTVSVVVHNGNIQANSSADGTKNCYSMDKDGASGLINTIDGSTNVVGNYNANGQQPPQISPLPNTGATVKNYPNLTAPSCAGKTVENNALDIKNSTIIDPGIFYKGGIKVSGNNITVTFKQGGFFCINGFTVTGGGNIVGQNIFIFLTSGQNTGKTTGGDYSLAGAGKVTMTPHFDASNPNYEYLLLDRDGKYTNYKGMLLYADPLSYIVSDKNNGTADFTLNGTSTATINGTIYLPTVNCTMNGNPDVVTGETAVKYNTQVLCNKVSIGGTASIDFSLSAENSNPNRPTLSLVQ